MIVRAKIIFSDQVATGLVGDFFAPKPPRRFTVT
jgi:hypothetical protein